MLYLYHGKGRKTTFEDNTNMKKIIAFVLCTLGIALVWGAWEAHTSGQLKQTKITNVGSTALQPLTEAAVPGFLKKHSQISLTVQGGDQGQV